MLYFAYGSNLHPTQMKAWCPSARFISLASLDDHRLTFPRKSISRNCGVSSVAPKNGEAVWGVVFEVDDSQIPRLDCAEGFKEGRASNAYERQLKTVTFVKDRQERNVSVQTYIAIAQSNPPPPSAEYLNTIIDGAKFWQLPSEYTQRLQDLKDKLGR